MGSIVEYSQQGAGDPRRITGIVDRVNEIGGFRDEERDTRSRIERVEGGELRRTAYWDNRIAMYVKDVHSILSDEQIKAVEDYWQQWGEHVNPGWAAWYDRTNGIFKPE